MQGIGDVAIDGPRFEEFLRSRKEFFEVSQGVVSQGGLARILLLGCTAGLINLFYLPHCIHCATIASKVKANWKAPYDKVYIELRVTARLPGLPAPLSAHPSHPSLRHLHSRVVTRMLWASKALGQQISIFCLPLPLTLFGCTVCNTWTRTMELRASNPTLCADWVEQHHSFPTNPSSSYAARP